MNKSIVHLFVLLVLCAASLPVMAEDEIYTNGWGGGDWSDPATWRGEKVPTEKDIAVISRDDHVIFDRDDTEGVTCHELHIDPGGSLDFKQRAGRIVARFTGKLQCYGAFRMDATKGRDDVMQVHLMVDADSERIMRFARSGSLIAVGRPVEEGETHNVLLRAFKVQEENKPDAGKVIVGDGCGIDLRNVNLDNVEVHVSEVDNTGAEYNERVNIEHNLFTDMAYLRLTSCDSAVVIDNTFTRPDYNGTWVMPGAISLHGSPLTQIRNTRIEGWYYHGVHVYGSTDTAVIDTKSEGPHVHLYWYGTNGMVQNFHAKKGHIGLQTYSMSGAVNGLVTDNIQNPAHLRHMSGQFTDWKVLNPPEKGAVLDLANGQVTLLNCQVKADQVNVNRYSQNNRNPEEFAVQSLDYVVAHVTGEVPPGAMVQLQTKGFKPPRPGAMDMNVRNSPAPILNNQLTPRPATMQSLLVRSWEYDPEKKLLAAPTYILSVVDKDGKVLKTAELTPADGWFRAEPNSVQPTTKVVLP